MNRGGCFIFLVMLLLGKLLFATDFSKNDILRRTDHLDQFQGRTFEDSVDAIINDLYSFDRPFGKEIIEQLLDITREKDPRAYLNCLNGYASFNTTQSLDILDSAYRFAHNNGINHYDLTYYKNKSYFFRQIQKFDSSMVYILKARDLAKSEDVISYADILLQMGDLYYSVELYNRAEKFYQLADSLLETPGADDKWRTIVLHNNLGLIEYERGNYAKTISIYKEAELSKPTLNNFEDSLSVSYYRRIIAECQYALGNYEDSYENIQFSYEVAKKHQVEDQLFATYLTLIRLFIKTDNKAALITYNDLFQKDFDCKKLPLKSKIACMLLNADIWDYLNNKSKALDYYKVYNHLKDSFAIQVKTAGLIQLQTEQEFEKLEHNYQDVKTERLYLIIMVILLVVLGLIIYSRSLKISRLNLQLTETNQTKDKLFSIISHDLKSPFNSLLGFSEMLETSVKTKNDKEIEEFSQIIHQTSSDLFVLISNLLDWAQSQRGSLQLRPEYVDISAVLKEVISLHKSRAKAKNINIDISKVEDQTVYADRTSLVTIFSNLLTNALKFTPENGDISFTTYLEKNRLVVAITDNGVGIPAKKLPLLFEIGDSKSTPGTNKEKGTGLGLLICKEFVEKNGGEIKVHSIEGEGTTFEVKLNRS